ncbi:glycosyltransferase [Gillisia sp. M10.2A]|uniref:Glycosyltransferase n=1 Tax=Gillisia lutea TaxID=2909668 RepID=A0ABS9EDE4_9FLAO|nr:glycosyltransferase family 2 protein [Gillisia lutea]MCF4100902.1 glycosyltransferase [Gillisia lutea]
MKNLISVIIPTFNRAHIIKETLHSVLTQTYTNWECIIIDDGSNDDTFNTVNTFVGSDKRFQYFTRPETKPKGAASCRNFGIEKAKGSFLQFLDSDDIIAPNKFEVQLQAIYQYKDTIATCKWARLDSGMVKDKKYESLPSYRSFNHPPDLLKVFGKSFTYFPLHTYLTPSSLIKEIGIWNEELTVNDDGEFFTRAILNAKKIYFVPNTYATYRSGSGNRLSQLEKPVQIQQFIKSWESIEKTIFNKTGIKNHSYVKYAKANLYDRIKSSHPSLIKYNKFFFKGKRGTLLSLYLKLINRLVWRTKSKG